MKRIALATTALFLLTGSAFAETKTAVATTTTESVKTEEVKFDYRAFSRDPKKFTGKTVKISGKVLQVVEGDDDEVNLRVATSGSYENIVLVSYTRKEDESRVLDDDRVTITGQFEGMHSYKSVGAGPVTIPHIEADKVEQAPVVAKRSRR